MPWDRSKYPKDWETIRASIQRRAGNCCERCWVPNYAVGYRDETGCFHPVSDSDNEFINQAGAGELSYREARRSACVLNLVEKQQGGKRRWFVIVCTTAHYPDPDPRNCDPANLHFWCQKHHLEVDRKHHLAVQRRNREERKRRVQPVLEMEEAA